jgi:predicted  nucleic acid-binding Zn-ribbon protein
MNLDEIAKFIEEKINASESTVSQMSAETTLTGSSGTTASKNSTLEKEFFDLIQKGNSQMDAYVKLFKKHEKEKGEIVDFLKEIIKDSREFDKFKNKFDSIPKSDKEKINSLDKLKEKLKQYESN